MRVLHAFLGLLVALVALPASAQDYALRTRVAIDGHGQVLEDVVILVEGETIVSVEPSGSIPAGATVIDLRDYTVLPGLIDGHVHIVAHFDSRGERPSATALHAASNARKFLESGFTTVRSLGAPNFVDVDLREAVEAGIVPGPRLLVSGQGLSDGQVPAAEGDLAVDGRAPDDLITPVREFVAELVDGDVDLVKIFATRSSRAGGTPTYSFEQLSVAIEEASKAGRPVAAHAHSAEGARRAILAGARTIEHGALLDDATIDLMVERGTFYVPNLYLSRYYLANAEKFGFNEEQLDWTRRLLPPREEVFRKAVERGVKIVFGTDAVAGMAGETFPEFERRIANGSTAAQAITSATSVAAEALGLADSVGNLEAGKLADIIAVEGNPLEDIRALGRVVFVMKGGRIYKGPRD